MKIFGFSTTQKDRHWLPKSRKEEAATVHGEKREKRKREKGKKEKKTRKGSFVRKP